MPKGDPEGYYRQFGGPRQKLLRSLRASGVADSSATALADSALGAEKKAKKKKQAQGLRQAIISRLRSIGEKARSAVMGK